MKTFTFENVIIEVTRKCNMSCEHCLRGNAQNKNIDFKYITAILEKCDNISTLTITGGEPSLNVPAIRFILSELKRLSIPVNTFYIATNGSKESGNMEFIMLLMELYMYQDSDIEDYGAMVHISSDVYHDHDNKSVELLKTLRFVETRDEGESFSKGNVLYMGRAVENFANGRSTYSDKWKLDDDEYFEGTVYINVEGFLFDNCDLSYDNQDYGCYYICHIDDFDDFVADNFLNVELENVA